MTRSVSADFVLAMEEKLEHGREKGYTGWDSSWKNISGDRGLISAKDFSIHTLRNKLEEEFWELEELIFQLLDYEDRGTKADVNLADVRHEAADVANVAMMIADMAGALNDDGS